MSTSDLLTKTMTFNILELELIQQALHEVIRDHGLKEHPIVSIQKDIELFLLNMRLSGGK